MLVSGRTVRDSRLRGKDGGGPQPPYQVLPSVAKESEMPALTPIQDFQIPRLPSAGPEKIPCPAALTRPAGLCYPDPNRPLGNEMPNPLDKLTWNFILAVLLTDCLLVFFIWREVFYRTEDTLVSTLVGIGVGAGISLSAGILYFSHAEVFRVIADRYLDRRFNQGIEVGKELGKKEVRAEVREETLEHTLEVLEKAGIELSSEVREQLRNIPGRASKQ